MPATVCRRARAAAARAAAARAATARAGIHTLDALLAACRAVSTEYRLPNLLTMVMDQALAWTGAQQGCIALEQRGMWAIEVQGRADRRPVSVLRPISLEDAEDVPREIIRRVARTGDALDLYGDLQDGGLADDTYFRRARPTSVRCLPLPDAAGRVSGVLYLENCRTERGTSSGRPDELSLLVPHIAIALGNARRVAALGPRMDGQSRISGGVPADAEPGPGVSDGAGKSPGLVPAADTPSTSQRPNIALIRARVARAGAEVERAKLRSMLVESESAEAYLHGLLEAAPDATVMTTTDGRIARVNQQTERLFGYRRGDLLGQPVEILIPERFRQAHADHRARYAAMPRVRPMGRGLQLWGRRRDGSEFPVEVSLNVFHAPDGFHILSSFRDVSERREAEQALLESERFARATFDALADHICVLDERATIVSTNAAWNTFAAANGADLERVGKGANYLAACAAATGPEAAAASAFADGIRAVMRGEQDRCATEYTCHGPREQRWFIARATRFPSDGPTRIVVAHEDVTELKLAEQELRTAKEAEEEARKQAEAAERQSEERRQEAERRRQVAENLRDVLATLNSSRSLDEVLCFIVSQSRRLLGGQAAALYRRGGDAGELQLQIADGLPSGDAVALRSGQEGSNSAEAVAPQAVAATAAAPGAAAWTAASFIEQACRELEDVPAPFAIPVPKPFQSVLATPVVRNDKDYGTLVIYHQEPHTFSAEEVDLASLFCDQAALAVENARLRDNVREAAVMAERDRLARDLHDAVTQAIFSATIIADALPRVWDRSPDEGRRGLTELRLLTHGALSEMRSLLLELRPAALLEKRLGDLIRQLTEALSSRTRISVDVAVQEEGSLPPDVHVALYRIVQEALNNVAKHAAGASHVSVQMRAAEGRAMVHVLDDGCGFDVAALPGGQLGLGIMQERAKSIGARLRIVSRPGRGTLVAATWHGSGRRRSDA